MTDFTELRRDTLARHLRKHLAGEVRFDTASRRLYSTDASIYQIEPLGVVIPRTVEDVVATVQIAGEMHVPITAARRRHQPVRPVDRPRHRPRLQQVPQRRPRHRSRRRASPASSPASSSISSTAPLAAHDLQFGPDVATASRANLGGMIGNNSAGSRSIVYGKTIDHVRRLDVVLPTAAGRSSAPSRPTSGSAAPTARPWKARIYRSVREVVRDNRDEIRRRFPRILRRVSGYNLDVLGRLALRRPTRSGCISCSSAARARWP